MAWDKNNNLLAGSFSNGYIYRINNKGKAFVIYDSDLKEIQQIVVSTNGDIYAAALGKPFVGPPKASVKPSTPKKQQNNNDEKNSNSINMIKNPIRKIWIETNNSVIRKLKMMKAEK